MWIWLLRTLVLTLFILPLGAQASDLSFLQAYKLLIVSGTLESGGPLKETQFLAEALKREGFMKSVDYDYIVTDSHETSAYAARDVVKSIRESVRPILVWSQDKGSADVLEALIRFPEMQNKVKGFISYRGIIGGSPKADKAPKPLSHYQLQKSQIVPLSLAFSRLWIWLKSFTHEVSYVLYSLSSFQRNKYLKENKEKIENIKTQILFVGYEDEPWSILKSHPYLILSKSAQSSKDPLLALRRFKNFYQIDNQSSTQMSFSKN